MGGDHGINVIVPAAIIALEKYENLQLILVGDEARITLAIAKIKPELKQRLHVHHASQCVTMDDLPSQAVRHKKDSSMRVAINLVKEQKADAVVSAGNTGALMATAYFVLKTIKGIDRPAIMAHIPSTNPNGFLRMLDLGGNVESSAEQLLQFAVMGSVVASAVGHIDQPRVALLNIGEEDMKGDTRVKQAAQLLTEHRDINYVGFAEGDDIFKDVADVIVCDGFVGNVSLKTTEGAFRLLQETVRKKITRNLRGKFIGLLAQPMLMSIKKRLNPSRYNGASLLGLRGIVVKSHGAANVNGFAAAIERAIWEVEDNVIELIENQIVLLLENRK